MRLSILLALSLAIAPLACAWNPPNGSRQESHNSVTISGYTYGSALPVTIKVKNWNTNAVSSVGSTTSGTSELFLGSNLYPWSVTVPSSMFDKANWTPSNLGPSTSASTWIPSAQLSLMAFQGTTQLYTFSAAAQKCTLDKMNAGVSQLQAGRECTDGQAITLYDPSGYGVSPPALAWNVVSSKDMYVGTALVRVELFTYESGGNTVWGMACRPSGAGLSTAHRTMVYDHGGAEGLDEVSAWMCTDFAAHGWSVAMSAYRGERMYVNPSWGMTGIPASYWDPAHANCLRPFNPNAVETSLGEVMDVHRLLEGLASRPWANTGKLFLWGHSHGGAITLRALQTGAQVRAAALRAPAWSWSDIYNDCATPSWPNGVVPGILCPVLVANMPTAFAGTPATNARSYEWRSPSFFVNDLKTRSEVTLYVQHGILDDTVQVGQSCNLVKETWGTTFDKVWHAPDDPTNTSAVATPIDDCGLTFQPAPRPSYSALVGPIRYQEKGRYLVVYDNLNHVFTRPWALLDPNTSANRDFALYVEWLAATWGA